MSQYTNLRHLSLSNISFAPLSDPSRGEPPYHGWNTFELSTELKKHLEVIEIKRAVFVEPRVIVGLLEMERSEGHGEGESVHEMMQRYLATFKVPEAQKQLEAVMARSHDDEEEETVGCKVILEDVYLESVSSPNTYMNSAELVGHRFGVHDSACGTCCRRFDCEVSMRRSCVEWRFGRDLSEFKEVTGTSYSVAGASTSLIGRK